MSQPFLAEIRIMGFNFAPRGWATCDGQTMPISQNTALFSLLGLAYGGDGRSTFGLPNLQGRAPMGAGNGPGLSQRPLGSSGGSQTVTLSSAQMAAHTHNVMAIGFNADQTTPASDRAIAKVVPATSPAFVPGQTNTSMNAAMIGTAGSGGPHNNMQSYQTLLFAIALQGIFPQRP